MSWAWRATKKNETRRRKNFQYENMEIIFVDHDWTSFIRRRKKHYFIIHSFSYFQGVRKWKLTDERLLGWILQMVKAASVISYEFPRFLGLTTVSIATLLIKPSLPRPHPTASTHNFELLKAASLLLLRQKLNSQHENPIFLLLSRTERKKWRFINRTELCSREENSFGWRFAEPFYFPTFMMLFSSFPVPQSA